MSLVEALSGLVTSSLLNLRETLSNLLGGVCKGEIMRKKKEGGERGRKEKKKEYELTAFWTETESAEVDARSTGVWVKQ